MNADRLLQHFHRISEAPEAISLMRRFVLDLAMRGKIIPQSPNDEPAAELLKRIETEKAKLMKGGKIKKKPVSFDKEDVPFPLPSGWRWAPFVDVAAIESNLVNPDNFPDHPHIAPDNIESRTGRLLDYQTIRQSKVFSAKHRFFPGHIVYSKIRPNLAKATLVAIEGLCSADMYPIRPFIDPGFLLRFMLSDAFVQQSIKEDNRVAMPKINQDALSRILVAVPPLAEQRRIVAKVDELMALCDQLEAAKGQREESRDRLVAASLTRLSQPADGIEDTPEAFRDHARFTFNHLSRLTTRAEHIKQVRQTILNLAMRGRLEEQDPNHEPASELLKRIQEEKERLIKAGKNKREQPLPPIDESQAPFDLPRGWNWARFPELGFFGRGKSKHRPRNDPALFDGGTHLFVQTGDVARSNGLILTFTGKYNDIGLGQSAMWPKGTLCITIAANIADSGILGFDACFPDSIVGFIPAPIFPNARYFEYFMRTAKANLLEFAPATAQKNINLGILNAVLIPLPPLAEQDRIVAKVDELLAMCDQLEAQLATTEVDSRRLLEAVLHEALNGSR
jgi:type I restriction enzyme, S subunit